MKFDEFNGRVTRIKRLAEQKSTGTPKELAFKLNISERTLYRLVEIIKQEDNTFEFCRKTNSYVLKN